MSTINKLRDQTGYKPIMVSDGKLRIEALEKRVKELKLTKGTK